MMTRISHLRQRISCRRSQSQSPFKREPLRLPVLKVPLLRLTIPIRPSRFSRRLLLSRLLLPSQLRSRPLPLLPKRL